MTEENIQMDDEEQKDAPVNEENVTEPEKGHDVEVTDGDAEEKAEEAAERDPLDVALEEIASLKDKYIRQVAEFDNYRKRTIKERAELILNGSEKAVKAILP